MFYGYHAYTEHSLALKIVMMAVVALLTDLYVYRGTRILFNYHGKKKKGNWFFVHWALYIAFLIPLSIYFIRGGAFLADPEKSRYYYFLITLFAILYIPKMTYAAFILMNDVLTLIKFVYSRIIKKQVISTYLIRKYFLKTGFIVSFLILFLALYGSFVARFQYIVRTKEVRHPEIPESFDGFKIVQISDLHLGSYKNEKAFDKAIQMINELDPDIIVFTGDMVNYVAGEAIPFIKHFKKLKAAEGMYSILGNHDFGDYVDTFSETERIQSMQRLVNYQEAMGFKVLKNESIPIKFNAQSIYLIGVDNIGSGHHKSYGRLEQALEQIPESSFNILLSHDPAHWEKVVSERPYPIALTLSGHTHGGQLGFRLGKISRSPVSSLFTYWGGLYKKNDKYLYVNTGLGSIGYLGRIGIRPEISEIILKKEY